MKTFIRWLWENTGDREKFVQNIGVYLAIRDQDWGSQPRTLNAFEALVEDLLSSAMWKEDLEKGNWDIKELTKDAYIYYQRYIKFNPLGDKNAKF